MFKLDLKPKNKYMVAINNSKPYQIINNTRKNFIMNVRNFSYALWLYARIKQVSRIRSVLSEDLKASTKIKNIVSGKISGMKDILKSDLKVTINSTRLNSSPSETTKESSIITMEMGKIDVGVGKLESKTKFKTDSKTGIMAMFNMIIVNRFKFLKGKKLKDITPLKLKDMWGDIESFEFLKLKNLNQGQLKDIDKTKLKDTWYQG